MFQWWEKRSIQSNFNSLKLKKTNISKLQKEDEFLLKNLQDKKYGVKILLITKKYCIDIAKNLKDDAFIIDMENVTFNLMSQFQSKLNIPIHYDLNDVLTKHVFIFIFNLPRCSYLKDFLNYLQQDSLIKKNFTLVYCTELETMSRYLFQCGFQLVSF